MDIMLVVLVTSHALCLCQQDKGPTGGLEPVCQDEGMQQHRGKCKDDGSDVLHGKTVTFKGSPRQLKLPVLSSTGTALCKMYLGGESSLRRILRVQIKFIILSNQCWFAVTAGAGFWSCVAGKHLLQALHRWLMPRRLPANRAETDAIAANRVNQNPSGVKWIAVCQHLCISRIAK